MGQRSAGDTIAGIYQAFLRKSRWAQADLARQLEIGPAALGKRLADLAIAGMPLTSKKEHPHVVWSVPKDWFPGGVLMRPEDVADVVRLVTRGHPGATRDRLLGRLCPAGAPPHHDGDHDEPIYLAVIEDAKRKRRALHMQYFTVSRGALEMRHVSVAKIFHDAPVRFVGMCHRDGRLKWFRADGVLRGSLTESEPHRPASGADIAVFVKESVDGFRDREQPVSCSFLVRAPESRWVERNLPWPLRGEPSREGLRVAGETAGLLRVARFVVGLGGAARAETPELAALVRELAAGALQLNGPSVRSIRSRGSDGGKQYGRGER